MLHRTPAKEELVIPLLECATQESTRIEAYPSNNEPLDIEPMNLAQNILQWESNDDFESDSPASKNDGHDAFIHSQSSQPTHIDNPTIYPERPTSPKEHQFIPLELKLRSSPLKKIPTPEVSNSAKFPWLLKEIANQQQLLSTHSGTEIDESIPVRFYAWLASTIKAAKILAQSRDRGVQKKRNIISLRDVKVALEMQSVDFGALQGSVKVSKKFFGKSVGVWSVPESDLQLNHQVIEVKRYSTGHFSLLEKNKFVSGFEIYGRDWRAIALYIKSRSWRQVYSYARRYISCLERRSQPLPPKALESGSFYTLDGKPKNAPRAVKVNYLLNKNPEFDSDEKLKFVEAIEEFGTDWQRIAKLVGTRNAKQVRDYSMIYFLEQRGKSQVPKETISENLSRSQYHYNLSPLIPIMIPSPRATKSNFSAAECLLFQKGLELYGRDWPAITKIVKTRDGKALRLYAARYFLHLFRSGIPLPAKVIETGVAYTLSGKPWQSHSKTSILYRNYSAGLYTSIPEPPLLLNTNIGPIEQYLLTPKTPNIHPISLSVVKDETVNESIPDNIEVALHGTLIEPIPDIEVARTLLEIHTGPVNITRSPTKAKILIPRRKPRISLKTRPQNLQSRNMRRSKNTNLSEDRITNSDSE